MPKKYTLRNIKNKREYRFQEAADTIGVHLRTIQIWYKEGLPVIEGLSPLTIKGEALRVFIKQREKSRKRPLKDGECFCLPCRKPVFPCNPRIESNDKKIGKDKESVSLVGTCPVCSREVFRYDSREISEKKEKVKEVKSPCSKYDDLPLFSQY